MPTEQKQFLTQDEACARYRHSRLWFYEKRKAGEIPYIKSGVKVLYDREDLDRYFSKLKRNVVEEKAA